MVAQLSSIPAVTLVVVDQDGKRSSYRAPGLPLTIGRGNDNHLVLNDAKVSRTHLRVDYRDDCIVIEDLSSKNGTYVDGKMILPGNPVVATGKVILGSTKIKFIAHNANDTHVPEEQEEVDAIPRIGITATELPTRQKTAGFVDVNNIEVSNDKALKFTIEPLTSTTTRIISPLIYEKYLAVSRESSIGRACATLSREVLGFLPEIKKINYLFCKSSGGRSENFSQIVAESEFAQAYLVANSDAGAILVKNVGELAVVHKAIMAIKNELLVLDIDIDRRLTPQQLDNLVQLQSLVNLCAPAFESLLLREGLEQVFTGMLETLVATVEAKDTYTYGHSERVCRYATVIADELELDSEQKKNLIISALCHDIGKVAIPDMILKKPTLLSVDEFEEMKSHPTIGADLLANIPRVEKFIGGIKHHHERWDGTGYPDGLKGENIPLFARIIALVDCYDAMTSGRTYSSFISGEEAADRLIHSNTELYDPEIVKIFARVCEQGRISKEYDTLLPAII